MSTRDVNTQDHHHVYQYVGPYRLEKTLGKGQTGKFFFVFLHFVIGHFFVYHDDDHFFLPSNFSFLI